MSAVKKLTNYFKTQIGYLEKASNKDLDKHTANPGYNNYTKYGAYFGHNGPDAYWCDYFVDYCFCQVLGRELAKKLLGGLSGYTPTSAGYFKKLGQWYTGKPQEGDLIFFHGADRINHTGYVYKADSRKVYTIEGNTSSGPGVERNGGCVAAKDYALTDARISGYGRPDWSLVEPDKKSGWTKEDAGRRYYLGDTGEYVRNAWHEVDGEWYWHDGAGFPVCNDWKTGQDGKWYYLGPDGRMLRNSWIIWKDELYRVTEDGSMFEGDMRLQTDGRGALYPT